MKKPVLPFLALLFILSCSEATENGGVTDNWTENQEVNFYNDCKDKLLNKGENTENAHAFCECCLLKVKERFSDGQEAMRHLTDQGIATIEKECSQSAGSEGMAF